jgi:hypothetical protein
MRYTVLVLLLSLWAGSAHAHKPSDSYLVQRFQNINRLRLIFIPDEIWYEDDGDLDRGSPW